ncbi:hypothetical protein Q8A73_013688 [Channa argus]|nr:hypothetical protein Q8A73_013688 [Channa argus]
MDASRTYPDPLWLPLHNHGQLQQDADSTPSQRHGDPTVPMMSYAEKPEDITKEEWMDKLNNVHIQRADMNRLIMNYLVTEGFKEAAEKFRMESGIEPSVDLDSLDERIKIREMILKGQIQEAIALINSLHPELLDTNRYLYFHLQQQHLIELIRLRETESALEFAQTQLAEQGEESRECLTEMERTLALLAFDNPEESPFGDLLNMMQRQKVWSEVNQAVLDYENRESTPKLAKLLKLLLWAQNELDQKKKRSHKNKTYGPGVFYPSLASLCSQRVVEGERGFLMSTMNSGTHLGTLLAGGMGSLCLDWYGWESMFYGVGFLSGLWALIVWLFLFKGDVPPKKLETSNGSEWTLSRTRWLSLFKKPSVWYSSYRFFNPSLLVLGHFTLFVFLSFSLRAMVFAHMCICSTSYTLLSWLPTYFKESFPHASEWVFNVIPWVAAVPSALAGGCFSDFLINRGYDVATVRKLMQFFAMGTSSIFLMLLSGAVTFTSAVIYVSVAMGMSTFTSCGASVNVQDLTPSCAGALYGFMNMLGAFMGLVLVSLSGYLIEVTLSWATVFSIITLVNVTGLGIFLIFGDARRPWSAHAACRSFPSTGMEKDIAAGGTWVTLTCSARRFDGGSVHRLIAKTGFTS